MPAIRIDLFEGRSPEVKKQLVALSNGKGVWTGRRDSNGKGV
ncbi:MAG: tautomerase family protein [Thiomonas sp.]